MNYYNKTYIIPTCTFKHTVCMQSTHTIHYWWGMLLQLTNNKGTVSYIAYKAQNIQSQHIFLP